MAPSPDMTPDDVEETSTNRRTSGRVSKQPQRFAATTSGPTKRKRSEEHDEGIGMEDDASGDGSEDETEGEPDEEEVREKRRATRRVNATRDKPVAKKPRADNTTIDLAIRTSKTRPKQSRRAAKTRAVSDEEAEGIFGNSSQPYASKYR